MAIGLQRNEDTQLKTEINSKGVESMLDLYQRARNIRRSGGQDFEQMWKDLADIYVDIFNTNNLGEFKVTSKLLFQILNNVAEQFKRPSRRFISDKAGDNDIEITPEMIDEEKIGEANRIKKDEDVVKDKEQCAKDTVDTIQHLGGLNEILNKNFGAIKRFLYFGDAFVHLAYGDEKQPIKYEIAPLMNVYIDPFANDIRRKNGVGQAGELLYIEELNYDKAKQLYPNIKFGAGRLPVSREQFHETQNTRQQDIEQEDRIVELGHYYNIQAEKPFYAIYAGSAATKISKDGAYPFIDLNDKPFIPFVPLHCFGSPKGIYNYGLGNLFYDFHLLQAEIVNASLNYVKDQYNPLIVANINGNAEEFFNQALLAGEAQALGEKGYIVNVIQEGQSTSGGNFQALTTPPLTQDFDRFMSWITAEVTKSGVSLTEGDRPATQTATTTVAEEASKAAFIEDINENNITNWQELDELTMAMLKNGDFENSDIAIPTKIAGMNSKTTLGQFVEDIQDTRYFVDVESRTGAWKTPAFQVAANNESIANLALLPAGSEGQKRVIAEYFRNRGMDISIDDLEQTPNEQAPVEGEAPKEGPTGLQAQIQALTEKAQPTV